MSRLSYLVRSPRRALTALGVVAAATTLTAGTGAYFADESASEGNSISAGTLALTTYGSASPVVDGNSCRETDDKFVDPAGYQSDCVKLGVASSPEGATLDLTHLVPTAPARHILDAPQQFARCFAVKNDGTVPLGLRIDVNTVGNDNDQALANALKVQIAGFNINVNSIFDVAAHLPFGGTESTLSSIIDQGPIAADKRLLQSGRKPLEPGQTRPYCMTLRLPETNQAAQDALAGTGLKLRLNFLGTSLAGDDARVAAGDYDGGPNDTTIPVVEDLDDLQAGL